MLRKVGHIRIKCLQCPFNKWWMNPKSTKMNIVGCACIVHISRHVTFTFNDCLSIVCMIDLAMYIHIYYFLHWSKQIVWVSSITMLWSVRLGAFCAYYFHEILEWTHCPHSLKQKHVEEQVHHHLALSNGPKGLTMALARSNGVSAPMPLAHYHWLLRFTK